MAIKITAIRLTGGTAHEHISHLWWSDPGTGKAGDNSRGEIVAWIESDDGKAFVEDARGYRVNVGVVRPASGPKYLKTHADGVWTNNLLALPQR